MRRLGRAVVALALATAGALVLASSARVRRAESQAAGALVDAVTGHHVWVARWGPVLYWAGGHGALHGLRITPACSAAAVVGPLLIACGALGFARRLRLRRVAGAALAGAAVLFGVNLGRLVGIAWAVDRYGDGRALWLSHVLAGSLLSVLAAVLAVGLVGRIAFGGRRG